MIDRLRIVTNFKFTFYPFRQHKKKRISKSLTCQLIFGLSTFRSNTYVTHKKFNRKTRFNIENHTLK